MYLEYFFSFLFFSSFLFYFQRYISSFLRCFLVFILRVFFINSIFFYLSLFAFPLFARSFLFYFLSDIFIILYLQSIFLFILFSSSISPFLILFVFPLFSYLIFSFQYFFFSLFPFFLFCRPTSSESFPFRYFLPLLFLLIVTVYLVSNSNPFFCLPYFFSVPFALNPHLFLTLPLHLFS
jgi:hypothetical protein